MSFNADVTVSDLTKQRGDEKATIALLARIADGRAALELAVGTGRITVPLSAQGVEVDGIDLSPAMVEQLRERPGGDRIGLTIGDMTEIRLRAKYGLVYLIFNSLFNLLDQAKQIQCFRNAALHLEPDGKFVVEAFVPSHLHRLTDNQSLKVGDVSVDELRVEALKHDPATQTIEGMHLSLSPSGFRSTPLCSGTRGRQTLI